MSRVCSWESWKIDEWACICSLGEYSSSCEFEGFYKDARFPWRQYRDWLTSLLYVSVLALHAFCWEPMTQPETFLSKKHPFEMSLSSFSMNTCVWHAGSIRIHGFRWKEWMVRWRVQLAARLACIWVWGSCLYLTFLRRLTFYNCTLFLTLLIHTRTLICLCMYIRVVYI